MLTLSQIQTYLDVDNRTFGKLQKVIQNILSSHRCDCLQGREADNFYIKIAFLKLQKRFPNVFESRLRSDNIATKHVRHLFSQNKRNIKRQIKDEPDQSLSKTVLNPS
jgi:hypothetical protein